MNRSIMKLMTALTLIISTQLPGLDYCYDEGATCWFAAEYLNWKIQNDKKLIPLVIEGPIVPDSGPVLGIPGSKVVLGNRKVDSKWRSGGRFSLGFWCDDCCSTGVEVSYLFLGKSKTERSVASDGLISSPFLAVPYINTNTGLESSLALAFPNSYAGKATYKVSNSLQGAELNSITHLCFCSDWNMDVMGGLRFLNFSEQFHFDTTSPFINPALGNVYYTQDKFDMKSNFYGIQLGANFNWEYSSFFLNLKAKIGVGAICQSAKVHGSFHTNDFTQFTTIQRFKGGYYALPSNIGNHSTTRFSVLPEVDVNFGYEFTDSFQINLGYNFIYVTNVLRAARQLDRKINPTQSALYAYTPTPVLVGTKRPKKHLRSSDLWIQGLSAGFEYLF